MPVIRISDPVFGRLQAIATPLVDTPASVIEKLLDFYDSHGRTRSGVSKAAPKQTVQSAKATVLPPEAPPDLAHTRISSAKFAGETASNWNDLVHLAHRHALARLGSFDALRSATRSNVASGRRADSGYHYLSESIGHQHIDSERGCQPCLEERFHSRSASAGSDSG